MDINEIAGAAASALVSSMATDMWTYVRTRTAQLISHGNENQEQSLLTDLDEMHSTLTQAPEQAKSDVARDFEAELRGQLKGRLRDDPDFAAQFAVLTEEICSRIGTRQATTVIQYGKSEGSSTFFQIGRDFRNQQPK